MNENVHVAFICEIINNTISHICYEEFKYAL